MANYKVSRIIKAGRYSESAQLFFRAFYQVLHRYVPKPYNGRVVLYKAKTEGLFFLRETDRVWRSLAKEVEVVEVDGNHVSI